MYGSAISVGSISARFVSAKHGLKYALVIMLVGCAPAGNSLTPETRTSLNHSQIVDSPFNYHFGYVPAGSMDEHEFVVVNDSSNPWEIVEAKTSCSCTVARLANSKVGPGESLRVAFGYTAGQGSFDDSRSVTLLFSDRTIPPLVLTVQARVREMLDLIPRVIDRQSIGSGFRRVLPLTVEGYGDSEVADLKLIADSDWFSFVVGPPVTLSEAEGPKQRWQVQGVIDSTNLKPGGYATTFQLRGAAFSKDFRMELLVTAPIVAVPHQMFFGHVTNASLVTKTISIRFAGQLAPADADAAATFQKPSWLDLDVKVQGNV